MPTRLSLTSRTVTVLDDAPGGPSVQRFRLAGGDQPPDLAPILDAAGSPIMVVILPPTIDARIVVGSGEQRRTERVAPESIEATHIVDVQSGRSYIATCPRNLLGGILSSEGRAGCPVESITSADYAWADAARATTGAALAVVAAQLSEVDQVRILAARDGDPIFLRRLPILADARELSSALELVSRALGEAPAQHPVVGLGDEEFRARVAALVSASDCMVSASSPHMEALHYDPAEVAAAYAGTGPRFVPPDVVRAARARTRGRGLLAAALAILCVGVAAFLDILDLRTELAAVRGARDGIEESVTAAVAIRDEVAETADMLATLEGLRVTAPRWTALLGSLADATPLQAHARALRATSDSVYVDIEGEDAAAVLEALRHVPWWRSLRTASGVEAEVGESGEVTERVTVAGQVDWPSLNGPGGQRP